MYTAEEIQSWSDIKAQMVLEDLAAQFFQADRWDNKALHSLTGVSTRTIHRWRTDGRPPEWLFLLLAWGIENRSYRDAGRALRRLMDIEDGRLIT